MNVTQLPVPMPAAVKQRRSGRPAIVGAVLLALVLSAVLARTAHASSTQLSIFEDDTHLLADPSGTLARFRLLGAGVVRLFVRWQSIAPRSGSGTAPRGFNAANPAAYPAANWSIYDQIVRDAQADGIRLDFDLAGGAPLWATGPGAPRGKPHANWEPLASKFASFVHAVAERYSGSYDPATRSLSPGNPRDLPRVSMWSVWNEPDYGPSLAPQGLPGHLTIEHSPQMYRDLVGAAWTGLHQTGHGIDTILFGEVAPRGEGYWGVFSGMKPLVFLRALYCVDSRYRQLRGSAAALRGCPTTAAGSRRFRAANPGLFQASGFSDHAYMRWYPPNREVNPDPTNHSSTADYSSLGVIGQLSSTLDRVQRVYGSNKRFPVYNTEYGYITSPPKHDSQYPWVSQTTAAYYLNWAEYISWRNSRVSSTDQYLLFDPLRATAGNDWGGFASGLLSFGSGLPKPTYNAYRLPLYLPVTSTRRGRSLEVWGCVRPAHYATLDSGLRQTALIQFQPGSRGSFGTVRKVTIGSGSCYFDVHVTLSASGTVRLTWSYPPAAGDPIPYPVYSRHVQVTVR